MSSMSRSIEKRIEELKSSIESLQTELDAYEKVFAIEKTRVLTPSALKETGNSGPLPQPSSHSRTASNGVREVSKPADATADAPGDSSLEPEFGGNRTAFISALAEASGEAGVIPKEIDKIFVARSIAKSENLIYNTLSTLVKQGRLERRDGRYYHVSGNGHRAAAPPAPKRKKRVISAEGLKRIKAASKKRWAKHRAAAKESAKGGRRKRA